MHSLPMRLASVLLKYQNIFPTSISAYFARLTPGSLDYKNSVISQSPEISDFKPVVIRIGALSYQKRDVKNIFHRMIN